MCQQVYEPSNDVNDNLDAREIVRLELLRLITHGIDDVSIKCNNTHVFSRRPFWISIVIGEMLDNYYHQRINGPVDMTRLLNEFKRRFMERHQPISIHFMFHNNRPINFNNTFKLDFGSLWNNSLLIPNNFPGVWTCHVNNEVLLAVSQTLHMP